MAPLGPRVGRSSGIGTALALVGVARVEGSGAEGVRSAVERNDEVAVGSIGAGPDGVRVFGASMGGAGGGASVSVALAALSVVEIAGNGLCIKPAVASTVSTTVDTAPYCTSACTQDSDCAGSALRGSDPGTKSCVSGYACGIAFVKGKQCCRNKCLCRDFTGPGPIETPIACQGGAAATCDQ